MPAGQKAPSIPMERMELRRDLCFGLGKPRKESSTTFCLWERDSQTSDRDKVDEASGCQRRSSMFFLAGAVGRPARRQRPCNTSFAPWPSPDLSSPPNVHGLLRRGSLNPPAPPRRFPARAAAPAMLNGTGLTGIALHPPPHAPPLAARPCASG